MYENAPATKSRSEEIKEETEKDPGLKKVTKCIIEGWSNSKYNIPSEAKSYWSFREELSIINEIISKDERLVISGYEEESVRTITYGDSPYGDRKYQMESKSNNFLANQSAN